MYRLYGKPFTMSMVPEGTLDEIGVPFETVTLPDGRSTDPAYLELRPDGLVPTFVDGDLVVYEGSAIAMHLADRHKEAGLAPLPGSRERAWWYQWMVWLGSAVHPTVANEYHADWYTTAPDGIDGVRQAARRNADDLWRQIDASVAGQTWLVGERFSTADILLLVQACMHWDCHAMIARERHVGAIVRRIRARPAMAELLERHGVEPFAPT
ncbi:MAG: glutathione S-transferase family protein [Alphaproteobacteria bacterium]|nr:glutathione S-transferase family protein [Alphaproteobacteria bacterium]